MKMYNLTVGNSDYQVLIKEVNHHTIKVEVNGKEKVVRINEVKNIAMPSLMNDQKSFAPAPVTPVKKTTAAAGAVIAPIPGLIKSISVKEGDSVNPGDKLLIMEAMKMENVITASASGTIEKISVKEGDSVNQDQELVVIGGE